MIEKDSCNRTIKEIIRDSANRELNKTEIHEMTPDMLKDMAAAADKKRARRYRAFTGIAAMLALVIAGAAMLIDNLTTDVEAGKNAKKEIVTENGIIIEDEGWGSSSEEDWVITDWSEVEIAKATIPELIVPGYVPEGYEFERLEIGYVGKTTNMLYRFIDEKGVDMVINQYTHNQNLEATFIEGDCKRISSSNGEIYIIDRSANNKAIIQIEDGFIIEIWYSFSESELIRLIESFH